MTDLQFDMFPLPVTFHVRCRINGKLAGFEIQAFNYQEVQTMMARDVPEAVAVIVLVN